MIFARYALKGLARTVGWLPHWPLGAATGLALGMVISTSVIVVTNPTPAVAAQHTPVVFVPGFMGSRLENEKGELWGSFLTMMLKGMKDLEYQTDGKRSPIRATGILQDFQLFGPLKAAGYQSFISLLEKNKFAKGRSLFLFAYDWRRSNLANARRLADFVESHEALRNGRFNLVAHSMGGLLASLYIKRFGGSSKVNYFITVATPHLGSADVLGNMLGHFTNDVTWFSPVIGKDQFLKVFLSFPSLYEQLPVDEGSCRLAIEGRTTTRNCGFFDPSFWSDPRLPRIVRRALPTRLDRYLKDVRNLKPPTCRNIPEGVRIFRFAGTGIDTVGQIRVRLGREFSIDPVKVPGDGVVTEFSAACGDRIETEVYFANHLGILENPTFRHRLLKILTGEGTRRGTDIMMSSRKLAVQHRASFAIDTRYIRPGGLLRAELRLRHSRNHPLEGEIVSAFIESSGPESGSRELAVTESRPGVYRIEGATATAPGLYRLKVDIPGAGILQDQFAVLKEAPLPPAQREKEAGEPAFRVLLSSPRGRRPVYRLGEEMDLIVRANRDAWLYCFHRQTTGGLIKIFPNEGQKDSFISGDRIHAIAGKELSLKMDFIAPAGKEQTRCFATDRNVNRNLPAELRKLDFTPLPTTTGNRLADIFKAIPNTKVSEAVLDIDVRP